MTTNQIVADILRRELPAGISWTRSRAQLHAADKGGFTRGGITVASWGTYAGLGRPATPAELDAITEAQALNFYRRRHVAPFDMTTDPLRAVLVDWGVTSSHEAVWRGVQTALKGLGVDVGGIDGIPGTRTRQAMMDANPRTLYIAVLDQRRRFYVSLAYDVEARAFLVSHPKTQLHNDRGWANRVWEFVALTPDRT
jgi:lysozyme family protein